MCQCTRAVYTLSLHRIITAPQLPDGSISASTGHTNSIPDSHGRILPRMVRQPYGVRCMAQATPLPHAATRGTTRMPHHNTPSVPKPLKPQVCVRPEACTQQVSSGRGAPWPEAAPGPASCRRPGRASAPRRPSQRCRAAAHSLPMTKTQTASPAGRSPWPPALLAGTAAAPAS